MSDNEKKSKKIGAGWWKNANGKNYLSCQIEIEGKKYNFSCFENNFKQVEKQPDMNIVMSVDK